MIWLTMTVIFLAGFVTGVMASIYGYLLWCVNHDSEEEFVKERDGE